MKNVTKRVNVNLTDREITALERLQEEMVMRNWNMNQSDIIREAIAYYCTAQCDVTFANEWKLKSNQENNKNP